MKPRTKEESDAFFDSIGAPHANDVTQPTQAAPAPATARAPRPEAAGPDLSDRNIERAAMSALGAAALGPFASAGSAVSQDARTKIASAFEGAANGASSNFLSWLQAQGAKAVDVVGDARAGDYETAIRRGASLLGELPNNPLFPAAVLGGQSLRARTYGKDVASDYQRELAEFQRRKEQVVDEGGGAYGAGELASAFIAPSAAGEKYGAMGIKEGMSLLQKAGRHMLDGATGSAAMLSGDVASSGKEGLEAMSDIGRGAGAGGIASTVIPLAISGGGSLLGKSMKAASGLASSLSKSMGEKAIGLERATSKKAASKIGQQGIDDVVEEAYVNKIITPGKTKEDVAASFLEDLKKKGAEVGASAEDIHSTLQADGTRQVISPTWLKGQFTKMANRADDEMSAAVAGPYRDALEAEKEAFVAKMQRRLESEVDRATSKKQKKPSGPSFSFLDLLEQKRMYGDARGKSADAVARGAEPAGKQQALSDLYDLYKGNLETRAELASPEQAARFKTANRLFSRNSELEDAANNAIAQSHGNRTMGLSEFLTGGSFAGAGAAMFGPAGVAAAVPAAMASHWAKTKGPATIGSYSRAASPWLAQKAPVASSKLQSLAKSSSDELGRLAGLVADNEDATQQHAYPADQPPPPGATEDFMGLFAKYVGGNQPAQRGDEQEAQDNYRKNR